jgi:hypothetical protein
MDGEHFRSFGTKFWSWEGRFARVLPFSFANGLGYCLAKLAKLFQISPRFPDFMQIPFRISIESMKSEQNLKNLGRNLGI